MRQILHLSDIHFGPPHLPEVAQGVLDLAGERRPHLVVVSGDLTQRAKPEQFRQAREFVDRFEAPTLVVPGNHDVPFYRVFERIFDPYGAYRRHFSEELEPVYEDEEILVIGVNTAHRWTLKEGRIHRRSLHHVEAKLRSVPPATIRIVVAHHHLIPPPRFDNQRVLRNAYEAVETFSRSGVDLVLSGHLHQAYVETSEAYYPTGRSPFLILHSGTSTSTRGRGSEHKRNTCNWVVIDEREVEVSHLGWYASQQRFLELSRHSYPRRHGELRAEHLD